VEIKNKRQANRQLVRRGQSFMSDMDKLSNHTSGLTLQAIGNKYDLTRERIRQLFLAIYGTPYTEVCKKRIKFLKEKKHFRRLEKHSIEYRVSNHKHTGNAGKALLSEYKFYQICKDRGFKIYSHPGKSACDFIVNGKHVDVKLCSNPKDMKGGSSVCYYHIGTNARQFRIADFFAVYIVPEDCFFIIPKVSIGHRGNGKAKSIYLPDRKSNYYNSQNKYHEFKDAWHLLNNTLPKTTDHIQGEPDGSNASAKALCTREDSVSAQDRTAQAEAR
jgi:hypothetical protein